MNIWDKYLQDLLQSFEEVDYEKFVINLVLTALFAGLLAVFYVRFGNTPGNRRRFSRTFLPLAMTTMVIIFIVKSSVALSLGLVGALSIVRFRSAIKDPEELVYLFLAIGLGLAAGADEMLIGIVAFLLTIGIMALYNWIGRSGAFRPADAMNLNIQTSHKVLDEITRLLAHRLPLVELRRVDEDAEVLRASFVVEIRDVKDIEAVKADLVQVAPDITLSFIEQRNVAL